MIDAAIVGLGWWGQVLARSVHGKSDRLRFVRGVTRTPSKAEAFARETGIAVDSDYEGMLRDPAVQAVVLATPHSQHVDQIVAAARAKKHVFVEKPLALRARDAERAFDACEAAGVVLAVGQNRRFLPAFGKLKEVLAAGRIGKILHIEGNFSGPSGYRHQPGAWRATNAESPSGGMTGKGLHITDLMIDLLGPPTEVDARSFRQVLKTEMDDTTVMLLRFSGGETAYLASLTATADDWRLQVFGADGWIEIRNERRLTLAPVKQEQQVIEFEPCDTERRELEAFADAILSGADYPVTREQAIANVRLLEAIGRSAAEERTEKIDL